MSKITQFSLERAYHEGGHLVAIECLFGDNPHFKIGFTTILAAGDSGGGVQWQFEDDGMDEEKLCSVLFAGHWAVSALLPDPSREEIRRRLHFSGDEAAIESLKLSEQGHTRALKTLEDAMLDLLPRAKLVGKELARLKTFFGSEGIRVVEIVKEAQAVAQGKDPARLQSLGDHVAAYRAGRKPSPPPEEWMHRGRWFETPEDWELRRARAPS